MDLVGPVSYVSLGGAKYILAATDKYSGHVWVSPLTGKDQVHATIQWYIGQFEATSGRRIRSILTDNGSEFINNKVSTLLAVEHIDHRVSSAYTPEQNGLAERSNRTILEMARTMLVSSGLPKSLWAEAVSTAAYIRDSIAPTRL